MSFHYPPSRPDQIRMQYDRQRAHQHSAERERRHSWSKQGNVKEMSDSGANGRRRLSRPTLPKKQSPAFDRYVVAMTFTFRILIHKDDHLNSN